MSIVAAAITLPISTVVAIVVAGLRIIVWLPRPVSRNPRIVPAVWRPIAVNPVVIRTWAWRHYGLNGRIPLVIAGGVPADADAD